MLILGGRGERGEGVGGRFSAVGGRGGDVGGGVGVMASMESAVMVGG